MRNRVGGSIQLRLHAAGRDAIVNQLAAIVNREDGQNCFRRIENARHVGEKDEAVGLPCGCDSDGHRIAIHVKDFALRSARDARHNRHVARLRERFEKRRVGRRHTADKAQLRIELIGNRDAGIDTGESHSARACGSERGHELRVDAACENFEDCVNRFVRGDAQPAHERALHAALFEETRHLLAAAMHDGHSNAVGMKCCDLARKILTGRGVIQQAAAYFDQSFHEVLQKSGCFFDAEREIEILNRLPRRAFDQIINRADDEAASGCGIRNNADVAEVRVVDGMEIGHASGFVEPDEGLVRVVLLKDIRDDFSRSHGLRETEVDGFENAALNGNELRGEAEFGFFEAAVREHFGHVAMFEDRIRREIFRDFAEAGFERGLAARAADTAFRVADDAAFAIDDTGFDERTQSEIRGGRIAAGVRDKLRAARFLAMEFGDGVDGLGQQMRGGMVLFIPGFVRGSGRKPEGSAEVDDDRAGVEELRREVHGDVMRRREQNSFQALLRDGIRAGGSTANFGFADEVRAVARISAVREQNRLAVGVMRQNSGGFGSGIAAKANNTNGVSHG